MAEDREGLLRHYREMRDTLLAAIDGPSDDLLVERTLDGRSVEDHLGYLALWDDVRGSEVTRISAGHDSTWRMTGEQDATYSAPGHALRLKLTLDRVRWGPVASMQRLLDAIASATDRALDGALYGEAALRSAHAAQHTGGIARCRGERGF